MRFMKIDEPLVDVTIKVPASEVGAFYRMAGEWLQGRSSPRTGAGPNTVAPWGVDPDGDRECARVIAGKLSANARGLFEQLVRADSPVTSTDLAEALGFPADKGASMVAGTLAWPGRHATTAGREFPIMFSDEGTPTLYWLRPEAVAPFAEALAESRGRR